MTAILEMTLPGMEDFIEPSLCPYYPEFIAKRDADRLYQELLALPWVQPEYILGGECRPLNLENVWFGAAPHRAPTKCDKPEPIAMSPAVQEILSAVNEHVGCELNSVLVNLYRDEHNSIGAHNDKHSEGSWDYPIASVSLGATRRFRIREMKTRCILETIELEHGSLLVMPAGFQAKHLHEVLKESFPCGPRINLTFRHVRE